MKNLRSVIRRCTLLLGVPLLLTGASAQAGVLTCSSKVMSVSLSPGGILTVGLENMGMAYMCNVNTNYPVSIGDVSAEVCKGWVALFTTAMAQGKRVEMNMDYGSAAAPSSCSGLSTFSWNTPNPYPYWVNFPNQ